MKLRIYMDGSQENGNKEDEMEEEDMFYTLKSDIDPFYKFL